MRYDKLLFISYAHLDNKAIHPQSEGWISRFHASLEAMLSMRIGREAHIWRDDKLQGNDVFADEIVEQFERTAMMISVLTPRYVESDWCTREIRAFCERAQQSGGLMRANKSRLFKIVKVPVDSESTLPPVVKDMLGYPFFTIEDGAPLELDDAYGERYQQDYNRRVAKLAWDVAQLLKQIEAEGVEAAAPERAVKVYLAECGYDRRAVREMLEAELKLHGYAVLPDRRLPLEDEADCAAVVTQQLAQCDLAIHLVGDVPGAIPDGPSGRSIIALQNGIAARQSASDGLRRLIWLPAGTSATQPMHRELIRSLEEDADAQVGADVITADLEQLKAAMHATLREVGRASTLTEASRQPMVFLVCVDRDRKATVPLRQFLVEQGFDVTLPAFEGSASAIREVNQSLFKSCDVVVVFYGAGDEAWKRSTDVELRKLRVAFGERPAGAPYAYLAEPRTGDKDDLLDLQPLHLINGLAGLDTGRLASLVAALHEGRTGP